MCAQGAQPEHSREVSGPQYEFQDLWASEDSSVHVSLSTGHMELTMVELRGITWVQLVAIWKARPCPARPRPSQQLRAHVTCSSLHLSSVLGTDGRCIVRSSQPAQQLR